MIRIRQHPKILWIARGMSLVGFIVVTIMFCSELSGKYLSLFGGVMMIGGTFLNALGASLSVSETQVRYGTKKFDIETTEFKFHKNGVTIEAGRTYRLRRYEYHPEDWVEFVALVDVKDMV